MLIYYISVYCNNGMSEQRTSHPYHDILIIASFTHGTDVAVHSK